MRILFGTDGSPDAGQAMEFLCALPLPEGTEIHAVSVVQLPIMPVLDATGAASAAWADLGNVVEAEAAGAREALDAAKIRLAGRGWSVVTDKLEGEPAHQIMHAATAFGADLVVLGTRGLTGLEGFFLGSVARNVAAHAHCSVLLGRAPAYGLQTVIVGVDGSPHCHEAVSVAARFPLPASTRFVVAHVTKPFQPFSGLGAVDATAFQNSMEEIRRRRRAAARQWTGAACPALAETGRQVEEAFPTGDPTQELVALAEQRNADLIVIGARGVSLIERLFLGSVADGLMKHSRRSLLVARTTPGGLKAETAGD